MQPCPSNVTNESDMAYYDKQWWDEFRRAEVDEILRLTGNKNSDYTGGNECDNPFANFDGSEEFGVQPLVGLSVRMADKFQRLKAFCRDGKLSVNEHGDTARDIFRDLIGYSLIAIGMLERDK
jgi:hypothetical protein